MPKKFSGVNSKAEEARRVKNEKASKEKEILEKAKADAYWKDDGIKNSDLRKSERKNLAEQKRAEALNRKIERQKLEEAENKDLSSGKSNNKNTSKSSAPSKKVTRADIQSKLEGIKKNVSTQSSQKISTPSSRLVEQEQYFNDAEIDQNLTENLNRLNILNAEGSAQDVDSALKVLKKGPEVPEAHPEKRMKAAYIEFEERRLPELKSEFPNLRLSQWKQMVQKEWKKSPSNPFNVNI